MEGFKDNKNYIEWIMIKYVRLLCVTLYLLAPRGSRNFPESPETFQMFGNFPGCLNTFQKVQKH